MAVCCQNLTLGELSSRSALSMLIGALFKKFGLFLNTPRIFQNILTTIHVRAATHITLVTMYCNAIIAVVFVGGFH
jgi:hypothetical protein